MLRIKIATLALLFMLFAVMVLLYAFTPSAAEIKIPLYGKFKSVPVNAITPKGWLRQYLINQKNGLTGHLENAGYPFNTLGWAAGNIPENNSIEKWWPYEQNGYWVDGMERCGLLLNDTFLLNKARNSIMGLRTIGRHRIASPG